MKKYEKPKMEIVVLKSNIITDSPKKDLELPFIPINPNPDDE